MAVVPGAIGVAVPHALVPVVASVVVAGVVSVITKFLLLYAKNKRARSIAAIRKAAMNKKITVPDAVQLIQADMSWSTPSQRADEDDATVEDTDPNDSTQKWSPHGPRLAGGRPRSPAVSE